MGGREEMFLPLIDTISVSSNEFVVSWIEYNEDYNPLLPLHCQLGFGPHMSYTQHLTHTYTSLVINTSFTCSHPLLLLPTCLSLFSIGAIVGL